ncbi:hypothetical protein [Halorussus sp. MSC15.2]|uniref:hypothetical protein n=1 Tax=Halorussus sp. MSC15.2 TaxID=2283638 RepID=UPI001967E0DE|nr:hypothetical protein [Halorussus sp. MSC15.2]
MTEKQSEPTDDSTAADIDRRDLLRGTGALAAFALAGVSPAEVAAQSDRPEGDLEALLEDAPRNWGRWGEDDELGAFNFLGSEEALAGMEAATRADADGVETFTLQISMTGEVANDPIFPTRTSRDERTRRTSGPTRRVRPTRRPGA